MLAPDVRVEFRLDRTRSTQLQLAQLETYVRELRAMFTPLNFDINRLDRAVAQAKAHASGAASQALVDTRAEIKRFGDQLDELQAVDLRVAVVGVVITAVGIALNFFA